MANYFEITRPEGLGVAKLDSSGRAEVQFTVKNVSGIRREGRTILVSVPPAPGGPVEKGWVKPDPTPQRTFEPGQSQTFVVKVSVPPKSPEGSYSFRLDTMLVDLPDEGDKGQQVSFTIPKREVKPNRWWIPVVAVVALVVIGVAVWLLIPKGVSVPNLKGQVPADAKGALSKVGLELDPNNPDLIDSTPDLVGKIADQNPEAGAKAKKGSTVTIKLGAVMVSVPDVQTHPLVEATNIIHQHGLQVGNVTTRVVPNTTGGFVLSQSIMPNTPVRSNTPIDLTVAQSMVAVPHLATLTVTQAVTALQSAQLVFAGVSGNQYTAAVVSSSPAEGTLVNVGTPVTLNVPSTCTGPYCFISGAQYQVNVMNNAGSFQKARPAHW